MTNVKQGDLAYIVGLQGDYAANNGHVVKVLRPAKSGRRGLRWWIEPQVKLRGSVGGVRNFTMVPGQISDCYLRPISGVPVDDEVTTEQGVPV